MFRQCRERPRYCSVAFTTGPVAAVREMARLYASRLFYPFVCWHTLRLYGFRHDGKFFFAIIDPGSQGPGPGAAHRPRSRP